MRVIAAPAIALMMVTSASAWAGTTPSGSTTVERKQTTTVERDEDGEYGNWGLLGILGLGGLAGLLGRNDRYRDRNPDGTFTTKK